MKFVAIQSNIKEAINTIEHATGENLNLPILKNLLIKIEDNNILFTATNLEIAITCKVSGKIIESGITTVPLAPFANLIANIQSDRLNFGKKGDVLEIKTDNYSATLQGLPADDFPPTPKLNSPKGKIEIKGGILKEAIKEVVIASQFSELRPELNAILFNFSIDSLRLVATDGFRLSEKSISENLYNASNEEPFRILVPLKATQEIQRIAKDDEVVTILHDENQVVFKTERAELVSRLTEGAFPDYSGIIPKQFSAEVTIDKEEFANALRLTGIFGQKSSEVKIGIYPAKKMVEVSSAYQALGENSYLIPAKIKGESAEVYFNWRYLADPIKIIKTNEIFMGLQEEANPALIKPLNDSSYFYILKPILRS